MRGGKRTEKRKENKSGKMCNVFVPKRNVICYVASQSHMTRTLVKFINDKVILISRTRYRVIGEQSFRAKKNLLIYTHCHTCQPQLIPYVGCTDVSFSAPGQSLTKPAGLPRSLSTVSWTSYSYYDVHRWLAEQTVAQRLSTTDGKTHKNIPPG